jgi:uncharacterized protein (TIGR04222 family)
MSLPLNPLDWRGPPFLLFMLAFGGGLAMALVHFRRQAEGTEPPRMLFTDPYLIAFLRGGHDEAVRLVLASLIDRGFLAVADSGRLVRQGGAEGQLRRSLEKAVLAAIQAGDTPAEVLAHAATKAATDAYRQQLEQQGLLPDKATLSARINRYLMALSLFWVVGVVKIVLAISRHHFNVGFLVVMLVLAPVFLAPFAFFRQTTKGRVLLRDLKTIFGHLKDRRASLPAGGTTNEVAMLGAVFGLQMLPVAVFPWLPFLKPAAAASGDGGGGWWGGHFGGSDGGSGGSCGSSCGSGCGGGGGCGGCGS